MVYASGVSDTVISLCTEGETIASALSKREAAKSSSSVHEVWLELYPKPFVLKRLVNRFTIKHDCARPYLLPILKPGMLKDVRIGGSVSWSRRSDERRPGPCREVRKVPIQTERPLPQGASLSPTSLRSMLTKLRISAFGIITSHLV
jgi:hypothetical protein